jgi:hypothetical protein
VRRRLGCPVYILPLPRRDLPRSSSDGLAVYLSPAVRPLTRAEVHFLVFHEIGHLVHRRLLPDDDTRGWARYCALRGIADTRGRSAAPPGPDHPHEVFAEDFRRLYGTSPARSFEPRERGSAPPLWSRPEAAAFIDQLIRLRSPR